MRHLLLATAIVAHVSLYAQTRLLGLTSDGGSANHGTVGSFNLETSEWTIHSNFEPIDPGNAARPFSTDLLEVNGVFYGVNSEGGTNDAGVIFKWDPLTNVYEVKF